MWLRLHVEIARNREQPVEHLANGKLTNRFTAHRLANSPQRGRELVHVVIAWDILRLEVNLRNAAIVAGGQPIENFREPHARASIDPAHDAEINGSDGPIRFHEQIPLVHVGMKEPGGNGLLQESEDKPAGYFVGIVARGLQRLGIADFNAIDPVDGHHTPIGTIPVDTRNFVSFGPDHMLGEFRSAGCFAPQIEFPIGPALEVGNDEPGAKAGSFHTETLQMSCRPFIGIYVTREPFANAGPQDLYGNLPAVGGRCAVDLGDGGRSDRHRIEFRPESFERLLETGFDACPDLFEGNWRQIVLQFQQIARRLFANKIWPRGKGLAQLDGGRPDVPESPRVIALPTGACESYPTGELRHAAHGTRCVGIVFDPYQRTVSRKGDAPLEEPPDMRCWSRHQVRLSIPNGWRPSRP